MENLDNGTDDGSNDHDGSNVANTGTKRQRKNSLDGKAKGKTTRKSLIDDTAFDLVALKKRRDSLDGSFKKARKNLTQLGPWRLPERIEDKFQEVALSTLLKMNR
jgi:hypothetical protein